MEKTISAEQFMNTVNEIDVADKGWISWRGVNVYVKRHLQIDEMLAFVNYVVGICFDEDDGTFMPEMRDFAEKCAVIEFFTNIALPDSLVDRYDAVTKCDIMSDILDAISYGQFTSMVNAIDDKIEYLTDTYARNVVSRATELLDTIDSLKEQFEGLFDGITAEDIANVTDAVNGGAFDEAKLVEAYWKLKGSEKKNE